MLKRHEIQVLRRAGHSLDEVAEMSGVSRRSVVRVDAEAPVKSVDNEAERARRDAAEIEPGVEAGAVMVAGRHRLEEAWSGGLRLSLLVAPGGRVLLKNEGTLEIV